MRAHPLPRLDQRSARHPHPPRPAGIRWIVGLLVFVAVGGAYGGVGMLVDTSGGALGMSPDLLAHAPVATFLWPGVWLLLAMSVAPALLAWALWRRPNISALHGLERRTGEHAAWSATMLWGLVTSGWILAELWWMPDWHSPLQVVVGAVGLAVAGLALLPSVRQDLQVGQITRRPRR